MKQDKNTIVRHHLLEIILWPNEDGSFTKILNSRNRLKELGIYDDFKMTIPLTNSEHSKLHSNNMAEEHKKKISEAMKDRTYTNETIKMMSESHKGRKHSDEARKKMSESHKGKSRKPFSEETRKKISEARKIYWENRRKMKEENHE